MADSFELPTSEPSCFYDDDVVVFIDSRAVGDRDL